MSDLTRTVGVDRDRKEGAGEWVWDVQVRRVGSAVVTDKTP